MVMHPKTIKQQLDSLKKYTEERDAEIVHMRDHGYSCQLIADRFYITRQRVYQIYKATKRAQSTPEPTHE
jgi:DNA invertase Pin-like site-specific DNA recombinase